MAMSVKQMQYQLFYLGYCATENPANLDAAKICEATKALQVNCNLAATGAWDTATINKSIEIIKDTQKALNRVAKIRLSLLGVAFEDIFFKDEIDCGTNYFMVMTY